MTEAEVVKMYNDAKQLLAEVEEAQKQLLRERQAFSADCSAVHQEISVEKKRIKDLDDSLKAREAELNKPETTTETTGS